jgi:hypothetical protein
LIKTKQNYEISGIRRRILGIEMELMDYQPDINFMNELKKTSGDISEYLLSQSELKQVVLSKRNNNELSSEFNQLMKKNGFAVVIERYMKTYRLTTWFARYQSLHQYLFIDEIYEIREGLKECTKRIDTISPLPKAKTKPINIGPKKIKKAITFKEIYYPKLKENSANTKEAMILIRFAKSLNNISQTHPESQSSQVSMAEAIRIIKQFYLQNPKSKMLITMKGKKVLSVDFMKMIDQYSILKQQNQLNNAEIMSEYYYNLVNTFLKWITSIGWIVS